MLYTSFPVSCEKKEKDAHPAPSSPQGEGGSVTGRKRPLPWCHPCSAAGAPPPFDLLLREGYRGRLRPRSRAVLPKSLPQDPFSLGVPLCPAVPWYSCPFLAVIFAPWTAHIRSVQGRSLLTQGTKGAGPGLTIFRQSRSPRARPMISISAVATFVAKGILYWSHSRVM